MDGIRLWASLCAAFLPEDFHGPPEAPSPCRALHGSPQRVETMRARAEAGHAVRHPADRTGWGVRDEVAGETADAPRRQDDREPKLIRLPPPGPDDDDELPPEPPAPPPKARPARTKPVNLWLWNPDQYVGAGLKPGEFTFRGAP